MYICVCKAITESMLKNNDIDGMGSICGKCVMKVVINDCVGGFFLSEKAKDILGMRCAASEWWEKYGDRHDPKLVNVVELLGSTASKTIVHEAFTLKSNLTIVEIPQGSKYKIVSDNGKESIVETD